VPTNDWITDPFAGINLHQLPRHVAEEFMDMMAEATNCFLFFSLILVMAIGVRPKPELCFLLGRLG